jgi:hypothetical protein
MIDPHCWIIGYVRSAVFQDLFVKPGKTVSCLKLGPPHSDKTLARWLPLAGAVSLYEPSGRDGCCR